MKTVTIRPFTDSDVERIPELIGNQKVLDNLRDGIDLPYTMDHAKDFIHRVKDLNPILNFGIEYKGELVGTVGIVPQKNIHRMNAEIGYWLGEPYWGKGIMTQAIKLACDYAFSELKVKRVFAGTFDYNIGSYRALEKAGFELECVIKDGLFKRGQFFDERVYSIYG